ncbi:MAG: tetratricopeptide repeat protein [Myxococcota bacterium]
MTRQVLPVAAWTALLLSGCDGTASVPLPDLRDAEAPVRAKVRRCREAVLRGPSEENWARYARTLDAHGMTPEAEQAYLAAAEAAGGAGAFEYLHLAGVAAYDLGPERAREHFERALSLRSDYMATHLHLANLEEKSGRVAAAREIYARVAARWESSHALLGLGRLALAAGDPKAALGYLERARELKPDHRAIYEALARAHARLGRMEESRSAAKRAGDLSREDYFPDPLLAKVEAEEVQAAAHFRRGGEHARAERYREAIQEFRAGLKVRPGYLLARHYLAMLLAHDGRTPEAIQELDRILARDPRHRAALESRARILLGQNRRAEAERDLRSLLSVDPENAWARAELGK